MNVGGYYSFESISDTESAKEWLVKLNSLSSNPKYIEEFSKDADKYIDNNFITKVCWELRGQHKAIGFVDFKYDKKNEEKLRSFILPMNAIVDVVNQTLKNPTDRYELMDKGLDYVVRVIHKRNQLVVDQIDAYVNTPYIERVRRVIDEKGVCKICVVQGYAHYIAKVLSIRHPEIEVTDKIYGRSVYENFIREPFARLLIEKLTHSKDPVPRKLIDYYWYYSLKDETNDHEATEYEIKEFTLDDYRQNNDDINSGVNDAERLNRDYMKDSPDNYTADELKQKVDALFEKKRNKQDKTPSQIK